MRLRELHIVYRAVEGAPRGPRPQIHIGADVARFVVPFIGTSPVERFGVLSVDTKHRVIGWDVISVGTLDACLVGPREVFRTAITQNAAAIVCVHNHPSGDPTPSVDDRVIATRLDEVGTLLGIPVLDHVVVCDDGRFSSMRSPS